jgi:hypothetical protein
MEQQRSKARPYDIKIGILASFLYAILALCSIPASVAEATQGTNGSAFPTGNCHLPWPKFGDAYVLQYGVYVMFYCELNIEGFGDPAFPHLSVIEYEISTLGLNVTKDHYEPIRSDRYSWNKSLVTNAMAEELVVEMEDHIAYTFVNINVRIYYDGHLLDKLSTVIASASSAYFDAIEGGEVVDNKVLKCDFDATTQSCDPNTLIARAPRRYDFIEVGTSNFGTLIEQASDWHVGLSVEVLKDLQDTLPDRAGVIKVNAAIGDEACWRDFYHFPKKNLDFLRVIEYNQGIYGVGRIGGMQRMIVESIVNHGISNNIMTTAMARRKMIKIKPFGQLLEEYGVSSVGYLKIDTEGFDNRIVSAFLDYLEAHIGFFEPAAFIQFENNSNSTGAALVTNRLLALGYRVYSVLHTTVAEGARMVFGDIYAEHPMYAVNTDRIDGMLPRLFRLGRDRCRKFMIDDAIAKNPEVQARIDALDEDSVSFVDQDGQPSAYYCQIFLQMDSDPENEVIDVSRTFSLIFH